MLPGFERLTLDIQIEYAPIRHARARFKGNVLEVRLPIAWSPREQQLTLDRLRKWGLKRQRSLARLAPELALTGPVWTAEAFERYVHQLNAQTFRVLVNGVRIGQARLSRLAQVNVKTRVLTFSCYAIDGMPPRALRYLVLHELAHLIEANHSRRFWALVERHEPDYRFYRAVAQAHHARAVHSGEEQVRGTPGAVPEDQSPDEPYFGYVELDDPCALT